MSTTEVIETTDALGEPIELYRFAVDTRAWTYCDGDFAVDSGGETYEVLPLGRDPMTSSGTLDKAEIQLTLPWDSSVPQLYRTTPPGGSVSVTIWRCHWDEDAQAITTPLVIWVGRVLGCTRSGAAASLRCEPVSTSLRRVGLRRHYQYMCPHVLYGPQCGVDPSLHTVGAYVLEVSSAGVVITGQADAALAGGQVSWETPAGQTRRLTILRVVYPDGTKSLLETAGRPDDIVEGQAISLLRGCRHTLEACRDDFGNAPAFGGFPYIPVENPHSGSKTFH